MIEFRKVNKWFGSLHVLKDIDLTVEAGNVVVVCGPSGSGKSTLIRCINRLETIQSSDIIVDGLSLGDAKLDDVRLRTNVGMVFQSFNLYPHMTVLRNITLAPVKVKGLAEKEAEKIAKALLDRFAVDPLFAELRDVVAETTGDLPNADFALAAVTRALRLPREAAFRLFALGRSTGWVAHAMEQAASGQLIRPRAVYGGSLGVE